MEKIIEAIKAGAVLIIGEFRGAKTETIRYVDKKTGQANSFMATNILVERIGSSHVVMISQQVPEGTDPLAVKFSAQKGKVYAFELSGLERVRGILRARMPAGAIPMPV